MFGGWGLDARIRRITRDHGDVEFWVRRSDDVRSKAALVDAGAVALATQPPEEACVFVSDGVVFSIAYLDRRADGTFTLQGRWSDWVIPPDSFADDRGLLDRTPGSGHERRWDAGYEGAVPDSAQRWAVAGQGHR